MSVTLTAKELREALEFVNPDGPGDVDQMETEITIWVREKDEISTDGDPMPAGLYCHLTEYPEEGCFPLFDTSPAISAGTEKGVMCDCLECAEYGSEAGEDAERFFSFEFEVWQGDEMVASASGPRADALREAMHYAAQYAQDGPVRIFEVTRALVKLGTVAGTEGGRGK